MRPGDPFDALGWHRRARRVRSPNFDARPAGAAPVLLVVHHISLPAGRFSGDAIERLFTNRLEESDHPTFAGLGALRVSSHFLIRRRGELIQFVSCDDRAWHAGMSQYRGRSNCNDDSIGIELEGLEGDSFEAAQYDALAALLPALKQRYPIAHVAGHEHIAPGRKADPGPGLDWSGLQKRLGYADQCFPEGVLQNTRN